MGKTILTGKQQEELNRAILDYLQTAGYTEAATAFEKEGSIPKDDEKKFVGLLEKKWTSVIRLQKKVMDMEKQISTLQEEVNNVPSRKPTSSVDWIPRPPEKFELTAHRSPITQVAFHPIFSLLASSSEDATIKTWDYETGDFERTLKGHTNAVQCVTFDPKGNLIVSCSADLTIKIWDMQNEYQCVKTLFGHDHNISCVVFHPSGDTIVSCSRDKTIKFWEVATGYCVKTLQGHDDWVRKVSFNELGTQLVSCSNDQTLRIWDFSTGEYKFVLRGHEHVVECAVFAPATAIELIKELTGLGSKEGSEKLVHSFVASGSRDRTIKIWDATTGQCLYTFNGHDNWVRGLCFHPSGKFLISVSDDKTMRIWDLKSGKCLKTYEAHSHFVTTIAFNTKSPVVATGSVDQTVKVWECR